MDSFGRLIAEAERQPFSGWDFAYLRRRYVEGKTPWDFAGEVRRLVKGARSMLDIGTGGGEFLSSVAPLPRICCATEVYEPNVWIAKGRLAPLGVDVIDTVCDDNVTMPQRGALPFRDEAFDFVIDRHEAFVASEVARVLKRKSFFATQQVGPGNSAELRAFFGVSDEVGSVRKWDLSEAVRQVESAGLKIAEKTESRISSVFLDVGAVAYYLKAIPWEVPGLSVERLRDRLLELHRIIGKDGGLRVTTARFFVLAEKE